MTESSPSLSDHLSDPSTTLLLAPADSAPDDRACIDLLTRDPPGETNALCVTLSASPAERLSVWQRESGGALPARATILDGSSEAADGRLSTSERGSVSVRGLPENPDLHDIGLAIADQIGAWRTTDEPTVACLHSLTALFATYDAEQVIELITALNDLCDERDVRAHHHADSDALDDETVTTLRPLYDAVLEHTPEGGWVPTQIETGEPAPSFGSTTPPPGGSAKTDPERPETVPMRHSFDTLLDLLSSPRRRTLLYYLKNQSTAEIPLDDLVADVHAIDRSLPVRDSSPAEAVRTELVHSHLPKLEAAGIVQYDPDTETVHYAANQGLESYLNYIETVELG